MDLQLSLSIVSVVLGLITLAILAYVAWLAHQVWGKVNGVLGSAASVLPRVAAAAPQVAAGIDQALGRLRRG